MTKTNVKFQYFTEPDISESCNSLSHSDNEPTHLMLTHFNLESLKNPGEDKRKRIWANSNLFPETNPISLLTHPICKINDVKKVHRLYRTKPILTFKFIYYNIMLIYARHLATENQCEFPKMKNLPISSLLLLSILCIPLWTTSFSYKD